MLNLHSTTTSGILSTTSPTSDPSSGVAFTSRAPDLNFGVNSSDTGFEMGAKTPMPTLHEGVELIVQETRLQDIEMERRSCA